MRYQKILVRELAPIVQTHFTWWGNVSKFNGIRPFSHYFLEYELRGTVYVMARKKSGGIAASASAGNRQSNDLNWLNIPLQDGDVETVLSIAGEPKKLALELATLFASEYDFSVRYNPERKNYSAFANFVQGGADGIRVGVSAYGGTHGQAAAALLCKLHLYQSDPAAYVAGRKSLGIG